MLSDLYTELGLHSDLREEVEAVWTSVSDRMGSYRVLPDGRSDIIVKFKIWREQVIDLTVVITGPIMRFYDVPIELGMGFVGVRLRPGFFERVLGFEPAGLVNENLTGVDKQVAAMTEGGETDVDSNAPGNRRPDREDHQAAATTALKEKNVAGAKMPNFMMRR